MKHLPALLACLLVRCGKFVAADGPDFNGVRGAAAQTIARVLSQGNVHEVLAAQNALDFMWQAGSLPLAQAKDLVRDTKFAEPADRIPRYLLAQP